MLRYTRCNVVILMAATAWLILSFISCIVCGFDSYTVLFSGENTVYESNLHTIQEMKDISHAVAAINITLLHRVYLNMIRRAQLCIDAGGNHFDDGISFQHLATVLISVFTLCYVVGLLLGGPFCICYSV
jgi:hypothetical protein